jgi:predicted DNA-binding transcriptional regulator AlpA
MVKLYTFQDLKREWGIPYCRVHIYRLVKSGQFPKPFKFTPCGKNIWTHDQLNELVRTRQSAA